MHVKLKGIFNSINDSHPLKALQLIDCKEGGKLISFNNLQQQKAYEPIHFNDCEITIVSNDSHPKKVKDSIVETEFGIVIFRSFLHSQNADLPILVTVCGISISIKDSQ